MKQIVKQIEAGCLALIIKGTDLGKVVKVERWLTEGLVYRNPDEDQDRYCGKRQDKRWLVYSERCDLTFTHEDNTIRKGNRASYLPGWLLRIDGLEESEQEEVYQKVKTL